MTDPVVYLDVNVICIVLLLAVVGLVSLMDMFNRLHQKKGVTE